MVSWGRSFNLLVPWSCQPRRWPSATTANTASNTRRYRMVRDHIFETGHNPRFERPSAYRPQMTFHKEVKSRMTILPEHPEMTTHKSVIVLSPSSRSDRNPVFARPLVRAKDSLHQGLKAGENCDPCRNHIKASSKNECEMQWMQAYQCNHHRMRLTTIRNGVRPRQRRRIASALHLKLRLDQDQERRCHRLE